MGTTGGPHYCRYQERFWLVCCWTGRKIQETTSFKIKRLDESVAYRLNRDTTGDCWGCHYSSNYLTITKYSQNRYKDLIESLLTLCRTWEYHHHRHTEFIRQTTLQSGAWKSAHRSILSVDRCQIRMFSFSLSLYSGGWLEFENLHISGKARNTIDNLDAARRSGLRRWPNSPVPYTAKMQVNTASAVSTPTAVDLNIHKGKGNTLSEQECKYSDCFINFSKVNKLSFFKVGKILGRKCQLFDDSISPKHFTKYVFTVSLYIYILLMWEGIEGFKE